MNELRAEICPQDQSLAAAPTADRSYLPTPDEILAACREIQTQWSAEERDRRARGLTEQQLIRRTRLRNYWSK